MRLLLAEDETELGTWLVKALGQNDCQVDWVNDGRRVRRSLKATKYDALIRRSRGQEHPRFACGPLGHDSVAKQFRLPHEVLSLTPREHAVLRALIQQRRCAGVVDRCHERHQRTHVDGLPEHHLIHAQGHHIRAGVAADPGVGHLIPPLEDVAACTLPEKLVVSSLMSPVMLIWWAGNSISGVLALERAQALENQRCNQGQCRERQ